jgi:ribonucleoside-diphosphate reductase beta chain
MTSTDGAHRLPGHERPGAARVGRRGESHLLSYRQLYELWERQQWATQDLDFTQDRIDWHERIDEEERFQRMYGLSAFFIGEQRVAAELGPMMRAAPDEDDAAVPVHADRRRGRHMAFFDRFYSRSACSSPTPRGAARETSRT